ncbi:MAG: hypothetical protein MJZ25_09890 [Fibrobacter sp.]|nr:hypothetical protein [Fibrobacter sp.]
MKKIFALTFAAAMACATSAFADCATGEHGAISIQNIDGVCTAVIYGDKESSDAAGDPTLYTKLKEFEASVNKVVYKRSGIGKKHQTVVLPFSASIGDSKCSLTGAKFYAIGKNASDKEPFVDKNTSGKWIVRTGNNPLSELDAHTPYIVVFESNPAEFTITCPNAININTKASALTLSKENWDFVGTYSGESWPDGNRNIYGMAGKAKDYTFNVNGKDSTVNVNIGDFVRAGAGASVPPMKAYLRYVGSRALSKAIASSELDDNSPENTPELISVKIPFREEACFLEGDEIIEFKTVNGKKTACIDGQSEARLQTLSIPEDVEVDSVVYNRKFKQNVLSTVMFPFGGEIHGVFYGAEFFRIADVQYVDWAGGWTVLAWQVGEKADGILIANTPYIINPYEASQLIDGEYLPFCVGIANSCATLNTTTGNKTTTIGSWSLRGTYEKLEYGKAPFAGSAYGFAVEGNSSGVTAGKFVKAKTGASVPPMRAYLKYVGPALKTMANASIEEDLPESLRLMLLDSDGNTMGIGRINTVTGEIKMDDNVWFDMKGRKMNHKPTVKGTYYNKGQKVIIK